MVCEHCLVTAFGLGIRRRGRWQPISEGRKSTGCFPKADSSLRETKAPGLAGLGTAPQRPSTPVHYVAAVKPHLGNCVPFQAPHYQKNGDKLE